MKVIGICAHAARSGKDTLAKCLSILLQEKGYSVAIKSLAEPLKERTAPFLQEEFGIDVFNCSDPEKLLIRGFLVAYGTAKRTLTQGAYFTKLMDLKLDALEKAKVDFVIVPDIRYADYESDEVDWLKSKGPLFYISLFENGEILQPPNEEELRNSPKLKARANLEIEWEHMSFEDCLEFCRQRFPLFEKHLFG